MGRSAYSSDFKVYLICYRLRTMINQRITTNGESVIYVGGGNSVMTQAAPNPEVRGFWREKVLLPGETADDFVEWTEAECDAWQTAIDARPEIPQAFVDMWIEASTAAGVTYGGYNRQTRLLWLYDIHDITYAEARPIMELAAGRHNQGVALQLNATPGDSPRVRALMPMVLVGAQMPALYGESLLEGMMFFGQRAASYPKSWSEWSYSGSLASLRRVEGIIDMQNCQGTPYGFKAPKLEHVRIRGLKTNFHLISAVLSAESLAYLVEKAANTAEISVVVDPAVMSKLTDGPQQWQQILTAATAKNISFTTP